MNTSAAEDTEEERMRTTEGMDGGTPPEHQQAHLLRTGSILELNLVVILDVTVNLTRL